MANIEEAIRRLKFLYETHGAEQVAAAQAAITASTTTTDKASLSLEKSFNSLERRYVSTVRAQQDYQRVQDKVNDAIKQNPALQERGNVILANANQQYLLATQGLDKYGKAVTQSADSSRLARHELINLSRQFQDVGVSLASGQSPLTVAIQQGAQIADVFANSTGTLKGFFSQAVAGAARFAKSAAGIATGAAAVGAALVLAAVQFKSGQNEIERSLAGVGAASGVTSKQINEIGAASSSAFGLSSSEARTAATAFAATGRIYGDSVATATAMVKDFAKATGTDAADATKQLAAALVDPAKGALELNKQFGFLDVTTLNYIRSLQAQGKEQEAQKALMEALIPKIQEMAKHTSASASAWDLAANAASNFFGIAGKYGPFGTGDRPTAFGPPKELLQPREDPEQARLKQMGTDADAAALKINGVTAQIQQLQGELAKLSQYREAINGAETAAEQIGNVRLQQLLDQEAALVRQAQWTQQIAAQYPGMSIEVAKQLDAMNAQLDVAKARGGYETLITQYVADQTAARAKGLSLEEAMAEASKKRELTEANAAKSIDDQVHSMENQIKMINARIAGTEAATRAEIAYQDALRQPGVSTADAERIRDRTRALSEAEKKEKAWTQAQAESNAETDEGTRATNAATDAANQQRLALEEAGEAAQRATGIGSDGMFHFGWQIARVTTQVYQMVDAFTEAQAAFHLDLSLAEQVAGRMRDMATQFGNTQYSLTLGTQNAFDIKLAQLAALMNIPIGQGSGYGQENIDTLNDNLEQLSNSTDSLNATMQNALSPFYSQDPRTTHLGFRAGVVGNPEWMVGGASNQNPLASILGPGATAPGMASGGSFIVGGGYSANDNRIAAFPVASGEQVIVNRNRDSGGAKVINIDNRTIITGSVDSDTLAKLKVSKFQQAQRMRAGMAGI